MQQKNELPEGWAISNLNEISDDIKYGYTASAEKSAVGPHLLRITDIQDGRVDWENVPFCKIKEEHISKYELKLNDIVFARTGATTGKSYIISSCPRSIFASYLIRLRPNENIDPKFLSLFFNTYDYWEQISQNISGIAQPNCSAAKLKELILPLPPLPEQHRIVSAIEALFARLDTTNEKLDRVREILRKFRQSVLATACNGKLTEGWRDEDINKSNVSELLETVKKKRKEYWEKETLEKLTSNGKILQNDKWKQKYKEPEDPYDFNSIYLPGEWSLVTIEQIASKVTDGDHNPPKRVEKGIPYLTAKNIKNWEITFDNCTYISPDDFEVVKTRYNPQKDDLIVTCVGTIGETTIVPNNLIFGADRNLAIIRLTEGCMDPKFLQYTLNAPMWKDIIKNASGSTAQPHLYLKDIRALTIPFPPLPEQQEIVRRVDTLFAFADSIESKVAAIREKTGKLRHSILAKAFSGELVLTEAEIARREGRDYETAEVLLERIKAEKGKDSKK